MTTVECIDAKSIEDYRDKYFSNWCGMRRDLYNWAHYSNCFLPLLKPLKNPFEK
ncbi:hypothetical protein [Liquorilactobacillus hordei]|uniref:hypothetical protein n=1 Tax=Liquorilactobacillus hordei TaxID=468911 RepID=UPI0039E8AC30